ncbi:anhydro-N-acetylmuramic acid kinase [Flammeovirgaceae bacterium SG7u.111]|nr:anhydro-N-acetylmuramic acid kinase [Flammeovirgaceae bacterium SG7u.132]WPO33166.1 anhydro-N-acetylmuramic acid kinase [Flammeovirgaceae bacterium SG7u.111]
MQKKYTVAGMMSGTSLDGLDLTCCEFEFEAGKWIYSILAADTFPYSAEWKAKLADLENQSALAYAQANADLGELMGTRLKEFLATNKLEVDFAASHGHTVFHQPEKKLTTQIGSGAAIAAASGTTTICDFRTLDVALGGQGAPLVPIGDELLFAQYDACLNLGGIANVSFQKDGKMIAGDTSACNMILNHLAGKKGLEYDDKGLLARSGTLENALFDQLNALPYFQEPFPKSLGKEWVLEHIFPLMENSTSPLANLACTFVHHIAFQLSEAFSKAGFDGKNLIATGGGTFNEFLVEKLQTYNPNIKVELPDPQTINYKEALIFAFLGVLRWRNETNCLSSVTGASHDNCGGAIYWAK